MYKKTTFAADISSRKSGLLIVIRRIKHFRIKNPMKDSPTSINREDVFIM
jgi:hypothetical protein